MWFSDDMRFSSAELSASAPYATLLSSNILVVPEKLQSGQFPEEH